MSIILRIVIDLFLAVGCFFAVAGALGMIRMPDAYTRMQSSTNIATLGLLGALMGALLYAIFVAGSAAMSIKIILIGVFALITNPVASHAICRAAYKYGVKPEGLVCDEYDKEEKDHE